MAHKWSQKGIEGYRKTHDGRYPPGQEPDPSAAWADTLGAAKIRWGQERATRADSFALGELPKKPVKASNILREYMAKRKLAIAAGEKPTETDKALGLVRKPEKPGKTETPAGTQMRIIDILNKLANRKKGDLTIGVDAQGKPKFIQGGNFPEGSLGRASIDSLTKMYDDSLGLAVKAQNIGVKDFTNVATLLREVEEIGSDDTLLLKETGLTRKQIQYLIDMLK